MLSDRIRPDCEAAPWVIAEIKKLEAALRDADMAIDAGQACRSEAEFTRWMRDSQRYRPSADLISREHITPINAPFRSG